MKKSEIKIGERYAIMRMKRSGEGAGFIATVVEAHNNLVGLGHASYKVRMDSGKEVWVGQRRFHCHASDIECEPESKPKPKMRIVR
jgi:hypothetical protein